MVPACALTEPSETPRYKGVTRKGNAYQAIVNIDGHKKYCGLWDDAAVAARAVDR